MISEAVTKGISSVFQETETWPKVKLGHLATWKTGGTPLSSNPEYYENGTIPWAVIADINDDYVYVTKKKITKEAATLIGGVAPEGAIFLTMYGSIGKTGIAGMEMATNQAIAWAENISPKLLPKFLYWFLLSSRPYFQTISNGSTQNNINKAQILATPMVLPPLEEQQRIIDFLDNATETLDSSISESESVSSLLKEKRQALISEAVTRGIPVTAERERERERERVEYRDSGVEWIGEIPAHWQIAKIGSLYTERREIVSAKDYPALSVTKNGIVPQLESAAKSDKEDSRKKIQAGDFAINSRSDRKGSGGVSKHTGSTSMITLVLEPRDSNHNNDYLNYLLRSVPFQEEFYRNGRGIVADLWTTRFQAMKDISLALPPLEEQAKIAEYLSNEKLLNETRLEAAEEAISLLKEKRQALISEAVTGQLDIDAYESLTS